MENAQFDLFHELFHGTKPVWSLCPDCEDYFCRIHYEHVSDCACPTLETWLQCGFDPYLQRPTDELRQWLECHPLCQD